MADSEQNTGADVFISYARALPGPKLELETKLWAEGYSTWSDAELDAGQTFEQVIIANVDGARSVVTIWTPPALKSRWVPYESKRALAQGKLIGTHSKDVNPAQDLSPDFYGEQCVPVENFADILNGLVNRGIRPTGRDEKDLPDSDRIQREATREWLNGMSVCDDLALLRAFRAEFERAKTIRHMVDHRIAVLEAELGSDDAAATALFSRAMKSDKTRTLKNFLEEFEDEQAELSGLVAERLGELDPEALVSVAEDKSQDFYISPRRAAEAEIRKRNTPPEEGILRINAGMHTATIKRISVTADGKRMATASEDKTVKFWSLETGELIRTFRPPIGAGDEGKVYAVTIDPDGKWVAAGGVLGEWNRDSYVCVFDTESGAITARFGPLPNVVNDLEVSPDGTRLASGLGGRRGLRAWSIPDGEMLAEDEDYGDAIYGLAFSPDGQWLAATSNDGYIRLYDRNGRLLTRETAPDGAQPFSLAFSPDGTRLAVGYTDSLEISLFDAQSLRALGKADTGGLSGGSVANVAFLADGRLAAGGRHNDGDHPVFVWEDAGFGTRSRWPGPKDTVFDLVGLPDSAGGGLALAGGEPSWSVFNKDGGKQLDQSPPFADMRGKVLEHFLVSPDGKNVWFGLEYGDETPVLFDLAGLAVTPLDAAPGDFIAPDISRLDIESWLNETAPTLTVKSGLFGKTKDKKLALEPYERSRSLAIAPKGQGFVLGTEWWLRRFDDQGDQVWEKAVPSVCWGVNLACEGRLVLAAYGDGTIRWHRYEDGEELLALFIHVVEGEAKDWVVWMPDGHYDASPGGHDLIGWHVNRGEDREADFYPVETFKKAFHNPEKVRAALDGI